MSVMNLRAIGEANRSADHVLDASGKISTAAATLADQVRAFFITLRSGPMERRQEDDPNYKGPQRRSGGVRRLRDATGLANREARRNRGRGYRRISCSHRSRTSAFAAGCWPASR